MLQNSDGDHLEDDEKVGAVPGSEIEAKEERECQTARDAVSSTGDSARAVTKVIHVTCDGARRVALNCFRLFGWPPRSCPAVDDEQPQLGSSLIPPRPRSIIRDVRRRIRPRQSQFRHRRSALH